MHLTTPRLKLRQWKSSGLGHFAKLNADKDVMHYFPTTLSKKESNNHTEKFQFTITENDWGLLAVELISSGEFIRFVGLNNIKPELPPAPGVEIGWRLAKENWDKGYATEAGRKCLQFAFQNLELKEVMAFTTTKNTKSLAVMKRLGMKNTHENFFHPYIDKSSSLCEHVLYSITKIEGEL